MRHFRALALGFALAAMLPRCAHEGPRSTATRQRVGEPSSDSTGSLQVTGPSGTMIQQTPCKPGDERPDGERPAGQVEAGFTLKRIGNRSPRWQTVPYAGYRCGS